MSFVHQDFRKPNGNASRSMLVVSMLTLMCCASDEQTSSSDSDPEATPVAKLVAELALGESKIQYYDLGDGNVVTTEEHPFGAPSLLSTVQNADLVAQYETLSGRASPQSLRDAVSKAAMLSEDYVDSDMPFEEADPTSSQGAGDKALTEAEFVQRYCVEARPEVCVYGQTSGQTFSQRTNVVASRVWAETGSVMVDYRLNRAIGGWETRLTYTVAQGAMVEIVGHWLSVAKRPLAIRVRDVDAGDRYGATVHFI